jgi:hypothetical protein
MPRRVSLVVLFLYWTCPILARQAQPFHPDAAAALGGQAPSQDVKPSARLKVFLDCQNCFPDYIREAVDLMEYVRDPREADVHVIVTSSETGSGGRERTVALLGLGRFKGTDFKLRALSESSDSEDTQRQRLATAITIGLLNYISSDGLSGNLRVEVDQGSQVAPAGAADDPWNQWVVSLQGSASMNGQESSRELNLGGQIGADRITDRWKVTTGLEFDYRREDFDLDEDEPLRAIRNEREFDWLVARSVNDHWSFGAAGSIESSSFNNIALRVSGGPGVEYNFFPYSAYTRRQLRMNYFIGPYRARYVEETLFFKTADTLAQQQASITLDQREPWGSLQAELEVSNFLPGLSRYRVQLEADMTIRIARGLSFSVEGSASRLRDQLAIPRRGVTPEEVLLRLRRLRSGYEYALQVGLNYTFGSIFNTIVNPRFGR